VKAKGDDERCPDCGALLILVGRRHLCRPPPSGGARGRGRPPIGERPM